ncbi:uncharacterized protein PV07_06759 [Cladophialophora immunda]|uniref:Uncharacterized protein n=1 Tax=Cladophialophora immunda TaxID=569365 RepID=A0A0D2APG4_9EURO|nr:uncharacterized protein PV07_06759 [Cladophialophora immunda]KIW26977.1 hypothetical protein PV07_06759 [Cladophialophora immunda]
MVFVHIRDFLGRGGCTESEERATEKGYPTLPRCLGTGRHIHVCSRAIYRTGHAALHPMQHSLALGKALFNDTDSWKTEGLGSTWEENSRPESNSPSSLRSSPNATPGCFLPHPPTCVCVISVTHSRDPKH